MSELLCTPPKTVQICRGIELQASGVRLAIVDVHLTVLKRVTEQAVTPC